MEFSEIGKILGKRHHSTIMHAVTLAEDLLITDAVFKNRYKEFEDYLKIAGL